MMIFYNTFLKEVNLHFLELMRDIVPVKNNFSVSSNFLLKINLHVFVKCVTIRNVMCEGYVKTSIEGFVLSSWF